MRIGAIVITDEYPSYNALVKIGYFHGRVNHANKQYVNGLYHTIEGFWSHLKRDIDGTYHHVSKKHLGHYCSEFEYRYNTRKQKRFPKIQYIV